MIWEELQVSWLLSTSEERIVCSIIQGYKEGHTGRQLTEGICMVFIQGFV
jgi:hypothetical protein